jgi:6,7-dimethyl-8-ribityllumazine synthase
MSSANKNLSSFSSVVNKDLSHKTIGLVVAEWNTEVTTALANGAKAVLAANQIGHIEEISVPGTFELSFGAQLLAQKANIDGVIAIGCVIQGETKHNDYINHAVAQGLTNVGLKYNKPVIFGVLTPNSQQQALDRAGGKYGNKGDEAAHTLLKMLELID